MRWFEIIKEEGAQFKTEKLADLNRIKELFPSISTYIQHVKETNTFLYRGLTDDKDEMHHNLMYPRLYEIAFEKFAKQAKLISTRNSVYCGGKDQASEYGEVFIAIPSNDFNITWSPSVYDLHTDWEVPENGFKYYIPPYDFTSLDGTIDLPEINPAWYGLDEDQLNAVIDTNNWWQDGQLEHHIASNLTTIEKWQFTEKWLLKYFKSLGYKSGDMSNAMTSGNEVMLRASELYLVPIRFEAELLNAFKSANIEASKTLKPKLDKIAALKDFMAKGGNKLLGEFPAGKGKWKGSLDHGRLDMEWDVSITYSYESQVNKDENGYQIYVTIDPKLNSTIANRSFALGLKSLTQDPTDLLNSLILKIKPLLPNLNAGSVAKFNKSIQRYASEWKKQQHQQ